MWKAPWGSRHVTAPNPANDQAPRNMFTCRISLSTRIGRIDTEANSKHKRRRNESPMHVIERAMIERRSSGHPSGAAFAADFTNCMAKTV